MKAVKVQIQSENVCPYCSLPVVKEEQDKCHYPISKRNGGSEIVIGHHVCNLIAEGNIPTTNEVRKAYAQVKYLGKTIVMLSNGRSALLRLRADSQEMVETRKYVERQKRLAVKHLVMMLEVAAKDDSIIQWMLSQKGLGPITVGGVVSTLWPIGRFHSVAGLWHYCGLQLLDFVVDGKAPKRMRGMKLGYSQEAFRALLDLNQSAIKGKNGFRELYVKFRAFEDSKHPELMKGHRMNRALRKVRKEFLKTLWVQNHNQIQHEAHTPLVVVGTSEQEPDLA